MSLPRYPEYKASGVEWLGEVPGHWDVIRLKNVLQRRITDGPHTTPEFVNDGVPFLSVDGIQDGELEFDGCRYISVADHEEYRKKALPQRDDLLMGKAASTGKIARVKVDFEFSIWSPLALIRLDSKASNAAFYEQSLKSPIVQAQIDNLCTANTQKNISMDDIPKLILTRPPLAEQTQIAAFLDRETAKIDELVAEQRRLMELLKEKRQAIISHAVTQGLNPHAPMKPSGIEWLGDVPAHWGVCALGYLATIQTGSTPDRSKPDYWEGEIPWLKTGEINYELILDSEEKITEAGLQNSAAKIAEVGTLMMAMYGQGITRGRVAILGIRAAYNQACAAITPGSKLFNEYAKYFFIMAYRFIRDTGNETSQMNLGSGVIAKIKILIPPMEEQRAIAAFLDTEIGKFDTLTTEAQRAIDLLQERRTALISAAVTGQIDVRPLSQTQKVGAGETATQEASKLVNFPHENHTRPAR